MSLVSIETAIADIKAGRMVIIVDDENRENEGDLVIAADKVTPEAINFMTKYGRGLVCMPIAEEIVERLELPMMTKTNRSKYGTAFTASIGASKGIGTGISAYDRAETVRVAVNPNAKPEDIVSPGHIFPLRAAKGGVLVREGHTEATTDLARLAGLQAAAVLCEILNPDGSMARMDDLIPFAKQHNLSIISIEDLITYRVKHENLVQELASARLPVQHYGNFTLKVFESSFNGMQHVALVKGDIKSDQPVLVRLHSECLTGDIFGSTRCDCGLQLELALEKIGQQGGVLLYMNQEGRGIGLANKIKAYALQDQGYDTVEANHQLGFPADQRDYGVSAQILQKLGINQVQLMTNNPKKIAGLERYGVNVVAREPIEIPATKDNISYLLTKRQKLGHLLSVNRVLAEG